MHYVYLLKLFDGTIYTGSTEDLEMRVLRHSRGEVKSTKSKRPVELVFHCTFGSKTKALQFEKYLKTGSGQAFRNRHLV